MKINQNNFEQSNNMSESWRMIRILTEMTSAIDTLNNIDKNCISIFGSAQTKSDSPFYEAAEEISKQLVQSGYGIITGGGPGIMEAANKGASAAGGPSVGLHIHLPNEQQCNKYVQTRCDFRYLFVRKLIFVKYSSAYVVMPGGIGTVDELSEIFALVKTKRIDPLPIILYNSKYWDNLIDWLYTSMAGENYIDAESISKIITVCQDPEQVISTIKNFVKT